MGAGPSEFEVPEEGIVPWASDTPEATEAIRARLLQVSTKEGRAVLAKRPPYGFRADFKSTAGWAVAALREDPNLQKARDKLVKYGHPDDAFWDAYVFQVYLARTEFGASTDGMSYIPDEELSVSVVRIQAVVRGHRVRYLMSLEGPVGLSDTDKAILVRRTLSARWPDYLCDAVEDGDLPALQLHIAAHRSALNACVLPIVDWDHPERWPVLHAAVNAGHAEVVDWLLTIGARPSVVDDSGSSAYTYAVASADVEALLRRPRSTLPAAPGLPLVTPESPESLLVRFSWPVGEPRATAPTHYELQWCPDTLVTGGWTATRDIPIPPFSPRQRTGLISGLEPATGYVIRVRLKNNAGYGLFSPQSEATTLTLEQDKVLRAEAARRARAARRAAAGGSSDDDAGAGRAARGSPDGTAGAAGRGVRPTVEDSEGDSEGSEIPVSPAAPSGAV